MTIKLHGYQKDLDRLSIFDIPFTIDQEKDILDYIFFFLSDTQTGGKYRQVNKPLTIFTPNPEQIVIATHHPWFAKLLSTSDINLPDGVGVSWAMKKIHKKNIPAIPGVEFMQKILAYSNKQCIRVLLLGGGELIAEKAFNRLKLALPELQGSAMELPKLYIEEKSSLTFLSTKESQSLKSLIDEVAQKVMSDKICVVFVALGAPKQELFINLLCTHALLKNKPVVYMAVGGSFDELSGHLPMAPAVVRRFGLKWLWRLVIEPWRIKRQLAIIEFVRNVLLSNA